jgi:arabinogalactan oligomer/maltooligosaccharide transport system permease protein
MTKSPWIVVKWVAIAAALALLVWVAGKFAAAGNLWAVVGVAFIAMCVLAIYGTKRAVPLKYLFPGLFFLVALQIWPIIFTITTSFTNYGDGHLGTKDESIKYLIAQSVKEVEGTPRYAMSVAVSQGADVATGTITLLLTDPKDGATYAATGDGLAPVSDGVEKGPTGKITKASGYTILNAREVNARSKDLAALAVPTEGGGIKTSGLSEAFVGKASMQYDSAADRMIDTTTGKRYMPANALWVPEDGQGQSLTSGWQENVGLRNYTEALTNETLRNGFLKILVWNLIFPLVSVISTFLLGMGFALLFNDDRIKAKGVWRSLLILPYALPGFVTALVWRQMFNQDQNFGLINKTFGWSIDWLGDPTWAKVAILVTNLWLGFPYMFLICTGALQAVPTDVKEAAKIDGASGLRTIRSIVMPLVLVAVGPLLVASYAFNFNNFALIYLLTNGGPFEDNQTQVGSTDLLITYAFRLAIGGTTPNFGFAAAISMFIFIIVALISLQGFRSTASLEDVN